MAVLTSQQRRALEDACLKARRTAEQAVTASLTALAVADDRVPTHFDEPKRQLRRGLRAKARQLGDSGKQLDLLIAECAYEQWHRLLFARFLAENNLLIHPEYKAAVTLDECEELADSFDEPDGWSVAARFASEILPGIFRLDDPGVQVRLAADGRHELEGLLQALPPEIFVADDALGWVYQFWQNDRKDEVNASEVKVGGADLGPVTQLFTENYMVRFLLENSLGAWWAGKHPTSPLLKSFEYLRYDEDRKPAAGTFDNWPQVVAQVTVMDPCCGSGHFLIEAFSMLWQMRVEEEGLAPTAAQDAVLRDNLFGLELDPRCVQIAMFNIALQAWKAGGAWRELPAPNIACSGISVKAPVDEWKALANGDARLESALVRLHILFRDADTLGSLIDPKRVVEITDRSMLQRSMEDVDWEEVAPFLDRMASSEREDPVVLVLGADAAGVARAARSLARSYTLVTTNVPYLARRKMAESLLTYSTGRVGEADLALLFVERMVGWVQGSGTVGVVLPNKWRFQKTFGKYRDWIARGTTLEAVADLGAGAFSTQLWDFNVDLLVMSTVQPTAASGYMGLNVAAFDGPFAKARALRTDSPVLLGQLAQRENPDHRVLTARLHLDSPPLSAVAPAYQGLATGDDGRFRRHHWELPSIGARWQRLQSSVSISQSYAGRSYVVDFDGAAWEGLGAIRGRDAWGRKGVGVSTMALLPVTLYGGDYYDQNITVLVPRHETELAALWCFLQSDEFRVLLRQIEPKLNVTTSTTSKVPFDIGRWVAIAEQRYSTGLPTPWTDDPTQWLFVGNPANSTGPLQVAVGRLIGYRWPDQPDDDGLNKFADNDGIVCLPSVSGEAPAADRLHELLAAAYGTALTPAKLTELIETTGSTKRNLTDWLQADFFKQHCAAFGNRPFVWHISDGKTDGFSALVNYHRLDRKTLERLTYTHLGSWIERQKAEVNEKKAGAEARLMAATALQQKLELILEGEPPYDVYVRWKELREQPIGWNPNLNDGVRLNIRPFVEAGVLRYKVNVNWKKDRGINPDGSERHNDLHYTNAEKQAARGKK